MNEIETNQQTAESPGSGYQISAEPVVQTRRSLVTNGAKPGVSAVAAGAFAGDSLAVLARDPKTLFVYWDLTVSQHLTAAGLDGGKVLLRVLRADGTEETTAVIDPLLGYAFAEVGSPGASYTCELGGLEGSNWRRLVHSNPTETPPGALSENEDADFATLPFHLSFQRLIDIFRASSNSRKTLTESIATMQGKARELRAAMTPDEWSRLVATAASSVEAETGLGLTGVQPNELAALLQTVKEDVRRQLPSPETRARWRHRRGKLWRLERRGELGRREFALSEPYPPRYALFTFSFTRNASERSCKMIRPVSST